MHINPLHFEDKKGTSLSLGDAVTCTKGRYKGCTLTFVFCITQHRFGFINSFEEIVKHNKNGEYGHDILPEPFCIDIPSLDFYYTPKNKLDIIKI